MNVQLGLKSALSLDLVIEMSYQKESLKYFNTTTKRAIDYVEITPYNKGNLWKIRKYFKKYEVWHGTVKKAYCTTLADSIKFIPNH